MNTILSYDDVRAALDRALAAPSGIRVILDSPEKAAHLKHRIYKFRLTDRKQSLDFYPEGDPRRGTSAYDCIGIAQDAMVLTLKKSDGTSLRIEEIEE